MGVVFEAFDEQRRVPVALKTLRTFDPVNLYRFKREYRAVGDLAHPNVVALYDLACEDGNWYLAMEVADAGDFLSYVRAGRNPPAASVTDVASMVAMQTATRTTARDVGGDGTSVILGDPVTLLSRIALPAVPDTRPTVDEVVDVERLREAMRQLVSGLAALHEADIVHRDIKSSNVLVRRDGRVVITDFGVVAELPRARRVGLHDRTAGTVAYMAPEQAAGGTPEPASDWYAVGVLLYAALTGTAPYVGPTMSILSAKCGGLTPIDPNLLTANLPTDLVELCNRLLAPSPAARPQASELLTAFDLPPPRQNWRARQFVGRERELAQLVECYRSVAASAQATLVRVSGEAGIGKTRFLHELIDKLSRVDNSPVVFMGRCHERESLAYNGFDGLMDELTLYIASHHGDSRDELIGDAAAWVGHLFPVFRRLDPARKLIEAASPEHTRAVAVERLIAVIAACARKRPLLMCIDDWQWSDEASSQLLDALSAMDAPVLLMVLSRTLPTDARMSSAVHLELGPLDVASQRRLVEQFGVARQDDSAWASAAGSPLFLIELAAHVAAAGGAADWNLHEAVRERVRALGGVAQRMAEMVVVAGEPVPVVVLGAALVLEPEDRERAALELRAAGVVATSSLTSSMSIESAHAAIRAALLEAIEPMGRKDHHLRLALALEGHPDTPTAALVHHFTAGGDSLRAAQYALQFAAEAERQLAFERARAIYEDALAVLQDRDDRASDELRAKIYVGLAAMARAFGGDAQLIAAHLDAAEQIAERWELMSELARVANLRGNAAFARGDAAGCRSHHERARQWAIAVGDRQAELRATSGIGDALMMIRELSAAREQFSAAETLAEQLGDAAAFVINSSVDAGLGYFLLDWQRGEQVARTAYELAQAEDLAREIAITGHIYSLYLREPRAHEEALAVTLNMLEASRRVRLPRLICISLATKARALVAAGRFGEAIEVITEACGMAEDGHGLLGGADAYLLLARTSEEPAERQRALDRSEAYALRLPAAFNVLPVYTEGIDIALALDDVPRARRYLQQLEDYSDDVRATWASFYGMRARVLIDRHEGNCGEETENTLARFLSWARELGAAAAVAAFTDTDRARLRMS